MPYEIALDRDHERGLDRYTISVHSGDVAEAHELADWLSAAALNPTATFTLDLSAAAGRARSVLLARTTWLRARGRVELAPERVRAAA